MKIYRLEHNVSGLGPYEHRSNKGYFQSKITKLIISHYDPYHYPIFNQWLDKTPSFRKHIKHTGLLPYMYRFGWNTAKSFLIDETKLNRFDFSYACYEGPIELEFPDGQVIFNIEDAERIAVFKKYNDMLAHWSETQIQS